MNHTNAQFFFPTTASIEAAKLIESQQKVEVVQVLTKADKARIIFKESYAQNPVPKREIIIKRFMTEAGLSKAGAGTYLQNMKKKAGYVNSKPVTA